MDNIKGELSIESPCHFVTWKITNFFDLPSEDGSFLDCPEFIFAGASWYLRMFPYGTERYENDGTVEIYMWRDDSSVAEHKVFVELGIKERSGEEYKRFGSQHCFNDGKSYLAAKLFEERSNLKERSDELVQGGTLTLYCHMRLTEPSSGEMLKTNIGDNLSIASEKSLHKAGELEKSSKVLKKMQADYKHLLESGKESDVSLVVSGKEFPAHRCILVARSSVFDAMFNHDTEEKKSGKVNIDDLDPDSFHHFLEHLYTGRVEALSDENAFGLYTAADKYDVQALKSDCLEYVQRTLSVDSFCNIMTLALTYHEKELMELAVEFFEKNLGEIVRTEKWQMFMSDNITQANELLIKATAPGKNQQ